MRKVISYHPTPHHLHSIQIEDPIIGHPTTVAFNSKLPTSYTVIIRCLQEILTPFLAFGWHLLSSTMMTPHFRTLTKCTTQSIPLLSVMSCGSHLVYIMTVPGLQRIFHHGWSQSMMSGSGIPAPWSIISSLALILSLVLITHPSKSALLMEPIVFVTLCPQIGLGNRH
jgi:hypothetical protein